MRARFTHEAFTTADSQPECRYTAPPSHAGELLDTYQAVFGTSPGLGGVQGRVVVADPPNACTPLLNDCSELAGSILLVRRGGCGFDEKVRVQSYACDCCHDGVCTQVLMARLSCGLQEGFGAESPGLSCAQLSNDCDSTGSKQVVRLQIRKHCPKTCGLCGSSGAAGAGSACEDDDAGAKAASGGSAPSCAAVATQCESPQIGSLVRQHCPKTCGVCSSGVLSCDSSDVEQRLFFRGPLAVVIGDITPLDGVLGALWPPQMQFLGFYPGHPQRTMAQFAGGPPPQTRYYANPGIPCVGIFGSMYDELAQQVASGPVSLMLKTAPIRSGDFQVRQTPLDDHEPWLCYIPHC